MPKAHELRVRLSALREIGNVMTAMKSLALVEIAKLSRTQADRRKSIENILAAAHDLITFYPELELSSNTRGRDLWVLLGSERGFCGDYNADIVHAWQAHTSAVPSVGAHATIVVGNRLGTKMGNVDAVVSGAAAAEEIPDALIRLLDARKEVERKRDMTFLQIMTAYNTETGVVIRNIVPLPKFDRESMGLRTPPLLYVTPQKLYGQVLDQYLYAAFQEIFSTALVVENQRRFAHMTTALRRLEERVEQAQQQLNRARQEEITQEIEVLLTGTGMLDADYSANG